MSNKQDKEGASYGAGKIVAPGGKKDGEFFYDNDETETVDDV